MDDTLRKQFAESMRGKSNGDEKTIFFDGKSLSTNELADEIEQGTEIGLQHCELLEQVAARSKTTVEALILHNAHRPA